MEQKFAIIKMKKKAYFFLVDSLIALGVLAIGLILIFSYNSSAPRTEQTFTVSDDVIKTLNSYQIRDINSYYLTNLQNNGNITDSTKPLLEQVAEFYYLNKRALIIEFLDNVTNNLIPDNFNYMIIINNDNVYNHTTMPIEAGRYVIPSRTITHGLLTPTEMYGPYIVEVLSWG